MAATGRLTTNSAEPSSVATKLNGRTTMTSAATASKLPSSKAEVEGADAARKRAEMRMRTLRFILLLVARIISNPRTKRNWQGDIPGSALWRRPESSHDLFAMLRTQRHLLDDLAGSLTLLFWKKRQPFHPLVIVGHVANGGLEESIEARVVARQGLEPLHR